MRLILIIFIICVQFIACKKKGKNLNENFDTNEASLISQSKFSSNAHSTSGCIKLFSKNGAKNLVFEGFKTDYGPDLRVYLSKSKGNSNFVEVGKLKATSGNFNYTLDGSINTLDYKYVLIWCEDFSVLFGNAQL
jgi:hypothetical protein